MRALRSRHLVRTAAVAAACLPFAVTLTACEDDTGDSATGRSVSSSAPADRPSGAPPRLADLVLTASTAPDGTTISGSAVTMSTVTTERAECRPFLALVNLTNGSPRPVEAIERTVEQAAAPEASTQIVLASFERGQAQRLLTEGADAVETCAGFTSTADGQTRREQLVRQSTTVYGEQTVAFSRSTSPTIPAAYYVIARQGDVLALFVTIDTSGMTTLPDEELIKRQMDRVVASGG